MDWSRHFISLDGYPLHFRIMGKGPAVMGFHGSPQASLAIEGFARAAAANGLCVIAPDTPGNGLSEALPGSDPETPDYARKMLALADYLGLKRFGLYGFHTGAATALVMAALAPDRIAAVTCDGLPAWTPDERQELLSGYLPKFEAKFDASHMAWLWARIEEQTMFFPWHVTGPDTRMVYDMPPVTALHANAMDLLDSGDCYRAPYRAAFAFQVAQFIDAVTCPLFIASTATDPLRIHLDRPPLSSRMPHRFETGVDLVKGAADFLTSYPGDPAPAIIPISPPDRHGLSRGTIDAGEQLFGWRGNLSGSDRPLVLIHDAGGSGRWGLEAVRGLGGQRPVISLDLPGHGFAAANSFPGSFDELTAAITKAVSQLGIGQPDYVGLGAGGKVAWALGGMAVDLITYDNVEMLTDGYPSLMPEWDGAHLVRAFRIARFEQLYLPWFKRDRHHRRFDGNLAPEFLHARAVEMLHAQANAQKFAALTISGPGIKSGRTHSGPNWWQNFRR